jgi:predicted aspartyl protease
MRRLVGAWEMRVTLRVCVALVVIGCSPPNSNAQNGPKAIGAFDDWIAATNQEAGQPVCFAFTRAQSSTPSLPGRGAVLLTVTQRASGRDAVAIEAGFAFIPNVSVTMQIENVGLDFYTHQRAAFARNGSAVVSSMARSSTGVGTVRSPGPNGEQVTDTFSMRGFAAAYAAISRACPTGSTTPAPVVGNVAAAPPQIEGPSGALAVPLRRSGGTLLVPVLINNAITLDFVVDSGAADVTIPADVVLTLMRIGSIQKGDFLGRKVYTLADGSTVPSETFRIRLLKVGNRQLENVTGSVASVNGSLLLGQSFLSRFKTWSIDNRRQVLLLN